MSGNGDHRRNLAELAAESGVSARTIRYYIARGILPGPDSAGRAAGYGPEHLERLGRIRELQQRGLTLAEVARDLGGATPAIARPTPWWEYLVDDGVVLLVRGDLPPWRLRAVRRALSQMTAALQQPNDEEEGESQ